MRFSMVNIQCHVNWSGGMFNASENEPHALVLANDGAWMSSFAIEWWKETRFISVKYVYWQNSLNFYLVDIRWTNKYL